MSYKRYIKRGGKVYGPYIYSSKRVGGKVVSEYLGQKPRGSGKKLFLSVFLIAFLLASIFLGVQYFNSGSSFSSESISPEVFDGTSDLVKFDEAKEEPKVLDVLRQVVNSVSNSFMSLVGYVTEGSEDLDSEDKEEKVRKNNDGKEKVNEEKNKEEGVEKVKEDKKEDLEDIGEELREGVVEGESIGEIEDEVGEEEIIFVLEEEAEEEIKVNETLDEERALEEGEDDKVELEIVEINETQDLIETIMEDNYTDIDDIILEINVTTPEEDPIEIDNQTVVDPLIEDEIDINFTENNSTDLIVESNFSNETVNLVVETRKYKIVIGRPVKWVKSIKLNNTKNVSVELPFGAVNVSIKIDDEAKNVENEIEEYNLEVDQINKNGVVSSPLTGFVIGDEAREGIFSKFFNWLSKLGMSGNVINEIEGNILEVEDELIIDLDEVFSETGESIEDLEEVVVEYFTEAPQSFEIEKENGKNVLITGPDDLNYTDVLAYTLINEDFKLKSAEDIKIYWQENKSYMDFDAFDLDADGIVDYLEWIVPHLSNQTFEIILITKAEHLDSNRTFIEDVYLNVSSRDGIFSSIPASHYLRVSFEQNLTPTKDITIYARSSENASVEVYEKDGTELIAGFGIISEDKKYQIYLTNLTGEPQDTFDLKIVGGNVDFDFVVDPVSGCDPDASTCGDTACNAFFITNRTSWAYSSDTCTVSYGGEPPQWNYILEDAACDGASVTGGNSGQCAKYNDGCGDIVYCPSYDRKGSAVTAGDCSGCDEGCGFSIDCEDLGAWFDFTSEFFLGDSTVYPLFSNYADNNGSLAGNGTAIFNVTVENTNGTVWLEINNTNYTANNLSINVWNYSFYLVNGTYNYTWWAYGNGTGEDLNSSSLQNYFIFNVNTISDVNTSLDIVLADNESVNPETDELNGTHVVLLNSNSSALKIAELNVDFSQGINWSDITADANSTLAKSFVHLPSGHSEISGNISLYVPVKDNTGSVYICPNATSLNDVNTSCPNRYFSFVTNVSEYYKLNVSGTGAAETPTSKLVIYDSNDTEGGSNVIQVNEQAYFYANYSDNVTGIPIVGATCNFSENSTGSFSTQVGTSYNATSLLYEYNKTFASNLTIDWSVNCYGNASYSNLTVNDTIIIANGSSLTPPAVIESYEPYTAGIGTNFNITATVTDADGIDSVLLEYSGVNYTMSNISSKYYYNFSFWTNGTRTFRIFANDTNGYSNSSENISINIYANNLTLQLKTAGANISQVKDNFTVGEIINLTDPPSFQFDFGFVEEEKLILWDKIKDLFL
ncbi:hypothetical protein HN832_05000 [archaeon]|jgi:hypothetical protein|nr:hypothetical protein [archaeon]MBT4532142.1 hypothetical protein [archaeon]MBT7282743.1 hypothetical protein [archaeon]